MIHSLIDVDVYAPGGREWLANPGRIHQRLCMAWPDGERDPRMLWRVEGSGVLVQTHAEPPEPEHWRERAPFIHSIAIGDAWEPAFIAGAVYSFALRCAPMRTEPGTGRKLALTRDLDIGLWLGRVQADIGLHVLSVSAQRRGAITVPRAMTGQPCTYQPVDLSGRALVVDAARLAAAVANGIGKGKAFGLGLLVLGKDDERAT